MITRRDVERFKENVSFDNECRSDGGTLDHYQQIATKSAIYPGQGTALGLAYVALKLNGEAGEFAEHVGKAMRDDGFAQKAKCSDCGGNGYDCGNRESEMACGLCMGSGVGQLTDERRALIIKEIGDVLWYLSAACNELDITLSEAAAENLRKLCDRTERDALRGSGDER